MLKIKKLELAESRLDAKYVYNAKLTQKIVNGANWEYRGECIDMDNDGHCICGHFIKRGFPIYHKTENKTLILGSECINYFQGVNNDLVESVLKKIKSVEADIAVLRAAAKQAEKQSEVIDLNSEYMCILTEVKQRYANYRHNGVKAPYEIWCAVASNKYCFPDNPPEYSRICDLIRWYKNNIESLKQIANIC